MRDGLSLAVGACAEDINDGLLVRAEAFHGGTKGGRILQCIEVGDAHYCWLSLYNRVGTITYCTPRTKILDHSFNKVYKNTKNL